MLGLDMLREMEQDVKNIRQNLKISHDRQKSDGNLKTLHIEFKAGEHVYLKVKQKRISL